MNLTTQQNNNQHDIHEDRIEIISGDYWLKRDTTDDVRLISSLNIIDDILHSLVVEPNPRDMWTRENSHVSNRSWEIDEFMRLYEPIDQDKAKEIRDIDLAKIQGEMEIIGKQLAIGFVEEDEDIGSTEKLISIASKNKSDMSLPIAMATEKNIISMKTRTEEVKSIIIKQKDFITDRTKALSLKSKNLSAIYQEQASRSLASIDGTIKFIAKLEKSIHTLDIFTGEGVVVHQLSEGKEASEDEKITFYQRKLFLDEEFWVNMANGGADYNSLRDFKDALKKDINIIKDMLPAEKSVVLMQFRRNEKRGGLSNDYDVSVAEAMYQAMIDAEERRQNEKQFLFIRNGENVFVVLSDDIEHGDRLFPTEAEISELFKKSGSRKFEGIEVDKYLNFKELANKKARDRHDATSLYYKRLLVLMYGLHERDKTVFGESVVGDWFGLDFQKENFKFVHDDEDALDFESKSLVDFQEEKNSALQVGSRVIADWRYIMDEENAKGMYSNSYHDDPQRIYRPIYTEEPQMVEYVDGKLCCYILCAYDHHGRGKNDKRIKVELSPKDSLTVIDNITSKEIDFYINSRRHRSTYAQYAVMLLGVRNLLRKEERKTKPSVDFLEAHISSLLPDFNKEDMRVKLFESMAFWRIQHRKHEVPDISIAENKKVLKEISEIFFNKTINNKEELLKEFAKENFTDVLTLATDNKSKYFIYSKVEKSERIVFGAPEVYPFVKKTTLKFSKRKGFVAESSSQVKYGFYDKNEEVIEELEKLEISRHDKELDGRFTESLEKMKSNITASRTIFEKIINEENVDSLLKDMFIDMKDKQDRNRTRSIEHYNISFPVGLWFIDKTKTGYMESSPKSLHSITQDTNIDMLIARYGSDELYRELAEWINTTYRTPNSELLTLKAIRSSKCSIFSLSSTQNYICGGDMPKRSRLDFNAAYINKKRDWNYPVHSSTSKEDIDTNYERETYSHYKTENKERHEKIIIEKIV